MKLLTVDIEAPLPDIPPPNIGEQWVLVRFHREPLGILQFAERGCDSRRLARLIAERFHERILRHVVADRLVTGAIPEDLLAVE